MRTLISMLIVVAAAVAGLCSVAPAASAREAPPIVCGWKPIKNVHDAHIQELAHWAVLVHLKQTNEGLRFKEVVSGEEQQVVAGKIYKLVIEATKGEYRYTLTATYRAVVYEVNKTRQLLSFDPAN